jgi:hypothetical protein
MRNAGAKPRSFGVCETRTRLLVAKLLGFILDPARDVPPDQVLEAPLVESENSPTGFLLSWHDWRPTLVMATPQDADIDEDPLHGRQKIRHKIVEDKIRTLLLAERLDIVAAASADLIGVQPDLDIVLVAPGSAEVIAVSRHARASWLMNSAMIRARAQVST